MLSAWRHIVSALLLLAAEGLAASTSLIGSTGGGIGRLSSEDRSLSLQGYQACVQFNWHLGATGSWIMGVQARQFKLAYTEDGVNKRATYNLYGAHLGLSRQLSKTFGMQFGADYYPLSELSALSSHSVLLNNERFKFSTWEQYKGASASGFYLRFNRDTISGQFSSRNRLRSGLAFSALQQNFQQLSTEITISNPLLSPEKTFSTAEVEQRLLLIHIELFLGLTF